MTSPTALAVPGTIYRITTERQKGDTNPPVKDPVGLEKTKAMGGALIGLLGGSSCWATNEVNADTLVITNELGSEALKILNYLKGESREHLMQQLSARASFEILA